ncbi:MAG: sugar phosphate isomerase/epimerase [Opitutus sp.]|nr:sugar phosphate isomerase/epimerase [Opitutus sp.]
MKLSVCVQTDEVPGTIPVALFSGSFAERARKAGAAGADGLELMPVNPGSLDAASLVATLRENRLEVAAISSGAIAFATGVTLLHPDTGIAARAQVLLRDLIALAAAVGAPLVTIGSFRGRLAPVGTAGRTRLAALLREGAEIGRQAGVRLVLEPINRYELDLVNTAAEGLAFIDVVGHLSLGLLLDTFHGNIEESSWTEPLRAALAAGKLWHVHVGDNHRLAPGRGVIDFPAIVRTLRAGGYQGFLSAELLARPDGDTAARQTLSHLRPLLEQPT